LAVHYQFEALFSSPPISSQALENGYLKDRNGFGYHLPLGGQEFVAAISSQTPCGKTGAFRAFEAARMMPRKD
jgi:hypothetical protein